MHVRSGTASGGWQENQVSVNDLPVPRKQIGTSSGLNYSAPSSLPSQFARLLLYGYWTVSKPRFPAHHSGAPRTDAALVQADACGANWLGGDIFARTVWSAFVFCPHLPGADVFHGAKWADRMALVQEFLREASFPHLPAQPGSGPRRPCPRTGLRY